MNVWFQRKIEKIILKILRRGRPTIKMSLKSEAMPLCVQDYLDDLVDDTWPDIEEEVLYRLRLATAKPYYEE